MCPAQGELGESLGLGMSSQSQIGLEETIRLSWFLSNLKPSLLAESSV